MATAAGLILSAVGTGLSFISLLQSNLQAPEIAGSTVTVACAQIAPGDVDDSVSGNLDVRLYNEYGESVGPPVIDQYVNRGNTAFKIEYDHDSEYDGVQTPYIKITGNDDAICIAWLTVTWADGIDWVWSGAFGRQCATLPYHYNDAILGNIEGDDGSITPHRPDCAWIDGDGSVGGDTTAFSVYVPYFTTENDGSSQALDTLCQSPTFATYQNDDGGGVTFWSPPPEISNQNNYDGRKRNAEPVATNSTQTSLPSNVKINYKPYERLYTAPEKNTKLIESAWEQHSAAQLCRDDLSWGPSFISDTENKFCDMSTKTLWDVCFAADDEDCFDRATFNLRQSEASIQKRGVTSFSWKSIEQWGPDRERVMQTVTKRV